MSTFDLLVVLFLGKFWEGDSFAGECSVFGLPGRKDWC